MQTVTSQDGLVLRVHGRAELPTVVYCPGLHGDWTLLAGLRKELQDRIRLVEMAYPPRLDWRLEDYARAIETTLQQAGIHAGWILGESFGSQVAWALLERWEQLSSTDNRKFQPQGLILAGGFVRYPVRWGVRLVQYLNRRASWKTIPHVLQRYVRFLKWWHRAAPELHASFEEFLRNRLVQEDRLAINSRYDLIYDNDPRGIASHTTLPVYYLTGFADALVPWPLILPWLKYHCPGYRGWRLIGISDHAVLCNQPRVAAQQIYEWMCAR
jgi:pimeloyl-ACP methyl ester carboxylesterase